MIQVLRGVAALMVVWHHATLMENERLDPTRGVWLSGAGGVDLFFVISGFVMVLSSRSLGGTVYAARTFLRRRVERVVPMYWLVTTAKLLLAFVLPGLAPRVFEGVWHIAASYLFLPSVNSAGAIHPVLIVGWTLNYEAAFYVLVALGLALRFTLVTSLLIALPALSLAGWRLGAHLPVVLSQIDPLLLEFAYGVLLAEILPVLRARERWQTALCAFAAIAGFAIIQLTPQEVVRPTRPFIWGFAAMLVVGSAVALEGKAGRLMPRWLLALGDASYSNYLIHTLVLAALGSMWLKVPSAWRSNWLLGTLLCTIVCVIGAQIVYQLVELPITRYWRRRRA